MKPLKSTVLTFLAICLACGLSVGFNVPTNYFYNQSQTSSKTQFVGEIVNHSYIKLTIHFLKLEDGISSLKGSYYEAISGKTFKIVGNCNTITHAWKLDCFDENNTHTSEFSGKENNDGSIEGKWSINKKTYRFYLKKLD